MGHLDFVIYFVGSGFAFFVGAASILTGVAISPWANSRRLQLTRNLAALIGSILVAISATPLEWWLYAVLASFTCLWLPLEWFQGSVNLKVAISARIGVLAVWLLALTLELPYQFTPRIPGGGQPKLFLIGDSVSAGMSDADKGTWPKLLAKANSVEVVDLSKMGATVSSARKQAERMGNDAELVLLEIGGNDVLGSTTADQFEERLDQLLDDVCRQNRTVLMLELPLPPFANRFGLIQRRLARKHGIILIPKRIFISVLTTQQATVDGVHLSPSGHALMASVIWNVISPAYKIE